ncbi:DUF935 domain-containing protein [Pseudoduganella sp. RAF53_2]|uniref:DUF935 domain-containing protein n=1 Tax=unclassified Pseudoduganella TaxID=2637179 RepID=UPI003F974486
MTQILDHYGQPIDQGKLREPQTARITTLENRYLTPMLSGLTPARLQAVLQAADQGSLIDQHRLFSDMEERDGHLCAEMSKRKGAIVSLPWDVIPPENATAQEKAATDWVREALKNCADAMEDLLLSSMDAVGHGFAPIEIEWRQEDGERLPAFHPRPQEWFQLNMGRTAITLQDGSVDGAALQPFGWVMHSPTKAKTGYAGRMGLYRTLVWPFLYKAYSLGDFAEFLETYGLPIIMGKYNNSATAAEKASLMRAVTALGHDARAIMPADMQIELQTAASGSGESGHLAMMAWADKTESKVILGQTLTADTGAKGGGSFALGKVHAEVRRDILRSDARQVAATITRDVVFPMVVLNRPGVTALRRCPRFVLDVEEPEDLVAYADALPKLVGVGFKVPVDWAHERLHIPQPTDGQETLRIAPQVLPADKPAQAALTGVVTIGAAPAAPLPDPTADATAQLVSEAQPAWEAVMADVLAKVNAATSMANLQRDLVAAFGGVPEENFVKIMQTAFAVAELKGLSDVQEGA